jgi:hypothetical protein
VNGKQYIGRDSHNNPNYLGSGPLLKKAIKKYGKENFKKEVIEECSSFEQMVEREEHWLNYYDVGNNPMFYNLQNSGKGVQHTYEIRKKIGAKSRGRIPSTETRKKMGLSRSGEKNGMYGRVHSDETLKKIKQKRSLQTFSEETRKRISESKIGERNFMYGKNHTEETKQKIRELKLGKTLSDESRHKMSKSRMGEKNPIFKGYIICIAGNYKGQRKTMSEWADILQKYPSGVSRHLHGIGFKNGIDGNYLKWEHEL